VGNWAAEGPGWQDCTIIDEAVRWSLDEPLPRSSVIMTPTESITPCCTSLAVHAPERGVTKAVGRSGMAQSIGDTAAHCGPTLSMTGAAQAARASFSLRSDWLFTPGLPIPDVMTGSIGDVIIRLHKPLLSSGTCQGLLDVPGCGAQPQTCNLERHHLCPQA
jgi:hypothetical protein